MEISEDLASAYQQETRPADRSACPSAEELTALVAGDLPDERRGALVGHLAGCSDCAVEVRLAREARDYFLGDEPASGADSSTEPVSRPEPLPSSVRTPEMGKPGPASAPVEIASRRRSRRLTTAFAVAAALVLAVGLAWQLRQAAPGPSGVERSVPSAGEVVPRQDAVLDRAPGVFAWPEEAGAEAYRVELPRLRRAFDLARPLEPVDVGAAAAGAADALADGDYLWRVEARGSVARRELGPFVFTIR